jgi:hypothetical protein
MGGRRALVGWEEATSIPSHNNPNSLQLFKTMQGDGAALKAEKHLG